VASLIGLVIAIGLVPLLIGWWRLSRRAPALRLPSRQALRMNFSRWLKAGALDGNYGAILASALLCALAFNLTFFWQELWLVLPKAWAGLHPILFHNDHDWTGHAPIAELLQGTGAVATLASGLAFLAALGWSRGPRPFFGWMAFQGLFQSLSQGAIGSLLPGNDVGRAFAYLGLGSAAKAAVLVLSVLSMMLAGIALARRWPTALDRRALLLSAALSILIVIPFRVPRSPIEVALIPVIVTVTGLGWLLLGASFVRESRPATHPRWQPPAIALVVLLLVFQGVLRPGIRF